MKSFKNELKDNDILTITSGDNPNNSYVVRLGVLKNYLMPKKKVKSKKE